MKKVIILFILLFLLLAGVVVGQNYLSKNPSFSLRKSAAVAIKENKFKVEVARKPEELQIGLSEKKSLNQDSGMLFIFPSPGTYSFWMKNMDFPIDIIFINGDTITTIHKNAKPATSPDENIPIYQPKTPSDKVLEINAGLADKYEFKEGDKVKFENIGN